MPIKRLDESEFRVIADQLSDCLSLSEEFLNDVVGILCLMLRKNQVEGRSSLQIPANELRDFFPIPMRSSNFGFWKYELNAVVEDRPGKIIMRPKLVLTGTGYEYIQMMFEGSTHELKRRMAADDRLVFLLKNGSNVYHVLNIDSLNNPFGDLKEFLILKASNTATTFTLPPLAVDEQSLNYPLNQIIYGSPGTGKSDAVAKITQNSLVIRTQFHPEYTHSDFVGSYRPVVGIEKDQSSVIIGYDGLETRRPVNYFSFVPGPLVIALEAAFNSQNQVSLVIEEINRGDCAAIFGEIFQLLDRAESGRSEYGITLKSELRQYFDGKGVNFDIVGDSRLYLPSNLSILATMNTSDQSLFPMDSAFKRRWDWISCPIEFDKLLAYTSPNPPYINDGKQKFDWIILITEINKLIVQDRMEDKQIGPWFVKPAKDGEVSFDAFLNKCLFYLWHDVYRGDQFGMHSPFSANGATQFDDLKKIITENGLDKGLKPSLLAIL